MWVIKSLFSNMVFLKTHKLSQVQMIVLKILCCNPTKRAATYHGFLWDDIFSVLKKKMAKWFLRTPYIFPNNDEPKRPATCSQTFAYPGTPHITSVMLLLPFFYNQLLTINDFTVSVWAYSETISLKMLSPKDTGGKIALQLEESIRLWMGMWKFQFSLAQLHNQGNVLILKPVKWLHISILNCVRKH